MDAANAAYRARGEFKSASVAYNILWAAVEADCVLLDSFDGKNVQAGLLSLLEQRLWLGSENSIPDDEIAVSWRAASNYLYTEGYGFWAGWYENRLRGRYRDFDLPAPLENEIQSRLLAQKTDWWDRGLGPVTKDIEGWIAELQPPKSPESEPEQNIYAITFKPSDAGPIVIEGHNGADQLLADQDALDRYSEAKAEAENLVEACSRTNAGGSLRRRAEGYLNVLGDGISSIQPSLAVQRGQTIRDILAAQLAPNPDPMIMPLSGEILLDLQAWQSAHNMMVLMDPELEKRDKAIYGPDAASIEIALDVVQQLVKQAQTQGVIDEEARDALVDAATSAEIEPEKEGRRYRLATESLKNLVKTIAQWCWRHKGKISAAVGGSGGSLYAAASWVQRNKDWLLGVFADNPNMIEWINYIARLPL